MVTTHDSHRPRGFARGARLRAVAAGVLALAAALTLGACGAGAHEPEPAQSIQTTQDDERPLVLATFTVLADIAENVAGDALRIESITKPGTEIHGYEPTPDDLRRAADADLILDNGLNLEAWFKQFVAELDAPHVVVSEGVDTIDIADASAGAGESHDGMPNPHAWMSPLNVQIYAENMAQAFAELDPANAEQYRANAAAYSEQLQQVHDELTDELSALDERMRALVTCEGAFSYLARDAGLTERYLWAVNAEQQATPRQVAQTIEFVEDTEVPAVFCESTVSDAVMHQVAAESGAVYGGTLYVDSLSLDDGPVPTYLDLIKHDTRVIIDGLTGGTP